MWIHRKYLIIQLFWKLKPTSRENHQKTIFWLSAENPLLLCFKSPSNHWKWKSEVSISIEHLLLKTVDFQNGFSSCLLHELLCPRQPTVTTVFLPWVSYFFPVCSSFQSFHNLPEDKEYVSAEIAIVQQKNSGFGVQSLEKKAGNLLWKLLPMVSKNLFTFFSVPVRCKTKQNTTHKENKSLQKVLSREMSQ